MAAIRSEQVAETLAAIANAFIDDPLVERDPLLAAKMLKISIIISDFMESQSEKLQELYDSKLHINQQAIGR